MLCPSPSDRQRAEGHLQEDPHRAEPRAVQLQDGNTRKQQTEVGTEAFFNQLLLGEMFSFICRRLIVVSSNIGGLKGCKRPYSL